MAENDSALTYAEQRLALPVYTYADAARYAQTSAATVRRWFKGSYAPGHAMQPVFQHEQRPIPRKRLNYFELVEVSFVAALRDAGLPLDSMRRAYNFLGKNMGRDYPFTNESFKTDGIGIFVDKLGDSDLLVDVSQRGREVARRVLQESVKLLEYDTTMDRAVRWHVRGLDRPILIDPRVAFGRPTIQGTGLPTRVISQRYHAGDSVEDLVYDFRLTSDQIDEALKFETELKKAS